MIDSVSLNQIAEAFNPIIGSLGKHVDLRPYPLPVLEEVNVFAVYDIFKLCELALYRIQSHIVVPIHLIYLLVKVVHEVCKFLLCLLNLFNSLGQSLILSNCLFLVNLDHFIELVLQLSCLSECHIHHGVDLFMH